MSIYIFGNVGVLCFFTHEKDVQSFILFSNFYSRVLGTIDFSKREVVALLVIQPDVKLNKGEFFLN